LNAPRYPGLRLAANGHPLWAGNNANRQANGMQGGRVERPPSPLWSVSDFTFLAFFFISNKLYDGCPEKKFPG
jgi:hypothetical protein